MAAIDWFQDAIIDHVLIDRFAGFTPKEGLKPDFLGGTLRGITDRLPYLENLGINTLWLSPFCKTSAYHGYHVMDFFKIEPRFGSLDDLKTLIDRAHISGIRIIADFVPNHCSRHHPFFEEARKNRQSRYFNWFIFDKWPDDYLCFLDVRELPKLNLDFPEARDHIVDAAKYWLSLGIDGFRLDHVIGPRHAFWKHFRREIKKDYPAAVLIGEAWLEGINRKHLKTIHIKNKYLRWIFGASQESIQKEYVGELDGVLDFRFRNLVCSHVAHGTGTVSDDVLADALRKRRLTYPPDYFLPTFLDNHDMNRFLFDSGNDKDKLKAAAYLQFSLKQPPVIYYGTEVGMTHESPVSVGIPHSDLQARHPMLWSRQDKGLLAFYKILIHRRKQAH
jgi:glycosidase